MWPHGHRCQTARTQFKKEQKQTAVSFLQFFSKGIISFLLGDNVIQAFSLPRSGELEGEAHGYSYHSGQSFNEARRQTVWIRHRNSSYIRMICVHACREPAWIFLANQGDYKLKHILITEYICNVNQQACSFYIQTYSWSCRILI